MVHSKAEAPLIKNTSHAQLTSATKDLNLFLGRLELHATIEDLQAWSRFHVVDFFAVDVLLETGLTIKHILRIFVNELKVKARGSQPIAILSSCLRTVSITVAINDSDGIQVTAPDAEVKVADQMAKKQTLLHL